MKLQKNIILTYYGLGFLFVFFFGGGGGGNILPCSLHLIEIRPKRKTTIVSYLS